MRTGARALAPLPLAGVMVAFVVLLSVLGGCLPRKDITITLLRAPFEVVLPPPADAPDSAAVEAEEAGEAQGDGAAAPPQEARACRAAAIITNGGKAPLEALELSYGYYRAPGEDVARLALTADGVAPGQTRRLEGQLAAAPCQHIEFMRDPVVTLCRRDGQDCRRHIRFETEAPES